LVHAYAANRTIWADDDGHTRQRQQKARESERSNFDDLEKVHGQNGIEDAQINDKVEELLGYGRWVRIRYERSRNPQAARSHGGHPTEPEQGSRVHVADLKTISAA